LNARIVKSSARYSVSDFVAGLSVSEHSRVFLFTADGTLLAHPNQRGMTPARIVGAPAE
jgi:hypothetical protein